MFERICQRGNPQRIRFARWLGALWMAVAVCAYAQTPKYVVQIDAPSPLEKLLENNLDIVRWSKRAEVTPGQMAQLYKTAPDQIKELLATEGYFTPQVNASRQRDPATEVMRFKILPGEPARVGTLDVRIVGAVTNDAHAAARIAEARAAIGLKPGDIFTQRSWSAGKDAVVQSLAHAVYAAAHITSSKVVVDPEAHTAQ